MAIPKSIIINHQVNTKINSEIDPKKREDKYAI